MRKQVAPCCIRCLNPEEQDSYHYGSGFFVGKGTSQYLVTASHVVDCGDPEALPEILLGNGWAPVKGIFLPNDSKADIAVFRIEVDLSFPCLSLDCLSSSGLNVGQEVCIYGYPKSKPLLNKGIIDNKPAIVKARYAGLTLDDDSPSKDICLWFEGISEPRLSGSPICFTHMEYPSEIRVAAVLAGDGKAFEDSPNEIRGFDAKYAVQAIEKDCVRPRPGTDLSHE